MTLSIWDRINIVIVVCLILVVAIAVAYPEAWEWPNALDTQEGK